MVLTSVREEDIVRVDKKGRIFLAVVTEKEKGRVKIRPLDNRITYYEASSREIVTHYKKMGRARV